MSRQVAYPYLVIRLVPARHLFPMPQEFPLERLQEIARAECFKRRTDTCLVVGADDCYYFYVRRNGEMQRSNVLPSGGFVCVMEWEGEGGARQ